MEMCGKKPDTVRIWCLRDKKFAADLAEAKETAKDASLASLGIPKEEIEFDFDLYRMKKLAGL